MAMSLRVTAPGDDVEEVDVAHHQVGRRAAGARRDRAGEKCPGFGFVHPLKYQGTARTGNRQPVSAAANSPPAAGALASASGARPSVRLVR